MLIGRGTLVIALDVRVNPENLKERGDTLGIAIRNRPRGILVNVWGVSGKIKQWVTDEDVIPIAQTKLDPDTDRDPESIFNELLIQKSSPYENRVRFAQRLIRAHCLPELRD